MMQDSYLICKAAQGFVESVAWEVCSFFLSNWSLYGSSVPAWDSF